MQIFKHEEFGGGRVVERDGEMPKIMGAMFNQLLYSISEWQNVVALSRVGKGYMVMVE